MIPSEGDHAASSEMYHESNGSFENNSYGSNQLSYQRHHSRNSSFLGGLGSHTPPLLPSSVGELNYHQQQPQPLDATNFSLQSFMTSKSSVMTATSRPHQQQQQHTQLKPRLLHEAPPVGNSSNPFALSEHEREYLDRIATTNPVYTLFKRLCVYFHGQYHLEEIMWRENVSRSELRTVLSTYQDIIVCCLHE